MWRVVFSIWTVVLWCYSIMFYIAVCGNSGLPAVLSLLVVLTWVVMASALALAILDRLWPKVRPFVNMVKKELIR